MGVFLGPLLTLVDSKVHMANGEKLWYIKVSLKGDAAQIVSSLLVTGANYNKAKQKLERSFNNKCSILKAHLAEIHARPVVKKESNVELQKMLESTNELLEELETVACQWPFRGTCNGGLHTSLHSERPADQQSGVTSWATFGSLYVLLSTAMVGIDDTAGKTLLFCASLDSGTQNVLHHIGCCIKSQPCSFNSRCEDL